MEIKTYIASESRSSD